MLLFGDGEVFVSAKDGGPCIMRSVFDCDLLRSHDTLVRSGAGRSRQLIDGRHSPGTDRMLVPNPLSVSR